MAARLKKDALFSLSALAKYFAQDDGRLKMVDDTQRYIASLRQTIADLKSTIDETDRRLQLIGCHTAKAKGDAEKLAGELQSAQAKIRQMVSDSGTCHRTIAELEKRLAPPEMKLPYGDKLELPLNDLRAAFRVAPRLQKRRNVDFGDDNDSDTVFFNPDEFNQHDLSNGYMLIGKFVVLMTGIGQNVGFLVRTNKRLGTLGVSERLMANYIHWIRNWIDLGKKVDRL